jgi:hypothetical protein
VSWNLIGLFWRWSQRGRWINRSNFRRILEIVERETGPL